MKPTRLLPKPTTAIPVRFSEQRERVLRILARWERTIRPARFERAS